MTEPVDPPVHMRMGDQIGRWVQAAIEQHGAPDQLTWDAFPQMFPSPTSEGLITVMGVYMRIPGAVMGTAVSGSMAIQPDGATAEGVNEAVRQLLESLRQGRSDQLGAMERDQLAAAKNGNRSPAGGLILPKP